MPIQNSAPEKDSSDFKSGTWTTLAPSWKMTSDLWGSPLDIRQKEQEYLERFPQEDIRKYKSRLENSVFKNEFRSAIETMAGMVFRVNPQPQGANSAITDLMQDIDLCGNSFWAWTLDAFQKFLRDGNGYIYVDCPMLNEQAQAKVDAGKVPTLADRSGDRPFLVFYAASQIINYRHTKVGSRLVLSQVTIEETIIEPDGKFGERAVKQHRVLEIGSWAIYRQDEESKKFVPTGEAGFTGLDEIPLIPIAEMDNVPPLLTLAMLNILHYRQTSDYDSICHLVCTPIQVRKFDNREDALTADKIQTASPGVGLMIFGEYSKVEYVEVTGTGMERAEIRYKDLEAQMAHLGVGMLAPSEQMSIKTATEIMDTAGQRQSKLAGYARMFENALEKVFYLMATCINGIKGSDTIDLNDAEEFTKMKLKIDYDRLTFSVEQLIFFANAVDTGKMSLETFLAWLPQVIDLPLGFDPAVEMERISKQKPLQPFTTEPDAVVTIGGRVHGNG